jgi:hypothetical protein
MRSLFKTLGAAVCLVFALCFAAPAAHADSVVYAINFIGGFITFVGPGPNQFDYSTTQTQFTSPSSFDVNFEGSTVLMVLMPGELVNPTDSFFWFQLGADISVRDTITANTPYEGTLPFVDPQNRAGPAYFTAQTPEPSTGAPMLLGLGLVLLLRKRNSRGHQLAT